MIYITGDTHRDFSRIVRFCHIAATTQADVLIILGDAGINYFCDYRDTQLKAQLAVLPITLFCIHGNHEARPQSIDSYEETVWHGGTAHIEREYPNLLFAKDGEVFDFDGNQTIVIGGAYSVDKHYRLARGWHWWSDEQPNDEIKAYVEKQLAVRNHQIDLILSHTAPLKHEPIEVFMGGIDQSSVDKSTEQWLDGIEARTRYHKWYCGHYHTNKQIDKLEFLFENIKPLTVL